VNKVLFEGKKAIGVEISRNGKISTVKASKEVILSAGAINTPKILLLSGVGPKSQLDKHQIPQIIDLPVGKNLQDHPQVGVEYNSSIPSIDLQQLESYLTLGKYFGLKTFGLGGNQLSQSLLFGTGFFNTPGNPLKFPDIQIHFLPLATNPEIYTKFAGSFQNLTDPKTTCKNGFAMVVILLHEKSIGSVTLNSKNPNDDPLVDVNFFGNSEDMTTLIKGVRIAESIADSKAFKGANWGLKKAPWNEFPPHSDDYWKKMILNWGNTLFHPVGTCKMGPLSDKTSVVHSNSLKIRGLEGIRVIDASVMPHLVSGNTASACVMIGEKGVDFIKKDFNL